MREWKDIKGYEGLYQISNDGLAKNLERMVKNKDGFRVVRERILKNNFDAYGYYKITLSKNSKTKSYKIHHLVWDHFGDKARRDKLVIDHINNIPTDNRIENLQLISIRENLSKDKDKTKTSSKYIGVCFNKINKKWVSAIFHKGKTLYLGSFDDEYDAHLEYQEKLNELR